MYIAHQKLNAYALYTNSSRANRSEKAHSTHKCLKGRLLPLHTHSAWCFLMQQLNGILYRYEQNRCAVLLVDESVTPWNRCLILFRSSFFMLRLRRFSARLQPFGEHNYRWCGKFYVHLANTIRILYTRFCLNRLKTVEYIKYCKVGHFKSN